MTAEALPNLFVVLGVAEAAALLVVFNIYLNALLSGWWFLAQRFRKPPNAQPRTSVRPSTVSFGWIGSYKSVRVGVSEAGLFLSVPAWLLGHPPILVPWHEIVPLGTRGRWRWFKRDMYRVGGRLVGFPTGSAAAALVARSIENG